MLTAPRRGVSEGEDRGGTKQVREADNFVSMYAHQLKFYVVVNSFHSQARCYIVMSCE